MAFKQNCALWLIDQIHMLGSIVAFTIIYQWILELKIKNFLLKLD